MAAEGTVWWLTDGALGCDGMWGTGEQERWLNGENGRFKGRWPGQTAKTGDLVGDSADFSQNGDINGGKWRDRGFGAAGECVGDGAGQGIRRRVTVRVTVKTGASERRGWSGLSRRQAKDGVGMWRLRRRCGEVRHGSIWVSVAEMAVVDGGAGGDHFRGAKE